MVEQIADALVKAIEDHVGAMISDQVKQDESWSGDFGSFHTKQELKQEIMNTIYALCKGVN